VVPSPLLLPGSRALLSQLQAAFDVVSHNQAQNTKASFSFRFRMLAFRSSGMISVRTLSNGNKLIFSFSRCFRTLRHC
jgi:hypothetical protein